MSNDTPEQTAPPPADRPEPHEPGSAVVEEADPNQVLDGHAVAAALLQDWRVMFDALHARFATGDFATGVALVDKIGQSADAANHHPDVDLRYPFVEVHLSSHDVGGVTSRDLDLAREISDHAGRLGATASPEELQVLEIALDTSDPDAVAPFWAALLGYDRPEDDDAVTDGDGRGPTLWFQQTEDEAPTQAPAQRFHLDLRVPPEVAERRIRAALDAGGTLVSDERAPSFTVLADAQGNLACVTTWLGRG